MEQDLKVEPITRKELIREKQDDLACKKMREDSKAKHYLFEEEKDGLLVRVSPNRWGLTEGRPQVSTVTRSLPRPLLVDGRPPTR